MIREVSDCKGCGMSPCYNCTSLEFYCDECEQQVDVADELTSVNFNHMSGRVCDRCLCEYVKEYPKEIVDLCVDVVVEFIKENL